MNEDVKRPQTEDKTAETDAKNPQAEEEEFQVSEDELEDAAGGRRFDPERAGRRRGGGLDRRL